MSIAVLAPSAGAAPAAPPLTRLLQTRPGLASLAGAAGSPAARKLIGQADLELARATVASLWLDPGHAVAPAYGASVFAHSRAALVDLEHVSASVAPAGPVAAAETSILAADRALAEGEIWQAAGGSGGLLARASGMILSGDRWALTTRLDLGAVQYEVAWEDAFGALTDLVVVRTTFVSGAALGRAAEAALRDPAIAPAGVRLLPHRRALTRGGKPELLFVGLESCRFCAIERWGLVVALSRFGTFSNLHLSQSATTSPPVVRSFTFAGSRYESPYVSFAPVELFSNVPRPGGSGYQPLGRLTPAQRPLLRTLDRNATSPFVDLANRFVDAGATVSPARLSGSPWGALASSLQRPRTLSGQAIAATAEVLTAEICAATGGAPAPVCGSSVVRDYADRLARFGGSGGGCPGLARSVKRSGAERPIGKPRASATSQPARHETIAPRSVVNGARAKG